MILQSSIPSFTSHLHCKLSQVCDYCYQRVLIPAEGKGGRVKARRELKKPTFPLKRAATEAQLVERRSR